MLDNYVKEIEDILLEEGIINISQFKEAWSIKVSSNKSILDVMFELNMVTDKDITFANSKRLKVNYIDLEKYEFEDENVSTLITEDIARRYCLIPLKIEDDSLVVAMKDPTDLYALDDVALVTKHQIKPVMGYDKDIEALIDSMFKPKEVDKQEEEIVVDENLIDNLDKDKIQEIVNRQNESNSPIFKSKIGKLLVNSGILTKEKLEEALKIQEEKGGKIGNILVEEGFVPNEVMYKFLEAQLDIPFMDLTDIDIPTTTISLVQESLARKFKLLPVEVEGDTLKVAMTDPSDVFTLDDLRLSTGMEIIPILAKEDLIQEKIDYYYKKKKSETISSIPEQSAEHVKHQNSIDTFVGADLDEEIKKVNEEIAVEINLEKEEDDLSDLSEVSNAPIVKMVNIILQKAIASRASDIHVEPYEDCVMVRYRVDGQLVEVMKHDKKILAPLVARLKIISSLNIAEKRIPQDGRISISLANKSYDMRVSTLPAVNGEKVVIRIADKEGFNVTKKDLGFFEDDLIKFDSILDNPHGIVLVTGPTGSGKSTTLYTALKELSKPNVNILTIEDPVECNIRGINQVQVNAKAGLTFGSALRAFLRQDPDIIMVGEIRDGETAEIATRAAITGHLVLSTLHTNDSASSITRMIDMGIEPFIISSSVVGVIAQRLVRRLCPKCKAERSLSENEKAQLRLDGEDDVKIYEPKGCSECNETGYKGRIAIYEIMNITREHREMIAKNVSSDKLKELSISLGMKTLRDNCIRLVKDGTTSIDEMLRVTYSKD